MLLTNKQIAIIGGGPAGLTLARLLQGKGLNVTVFERDKNAQARVWGSTLDLHQGSGQQAMEKAGLLKSYFDLALPMGRIITDEKCHVLMTRGVDDRNPEINRTVLRNLLLGSLANDTVKWDRKLVGLAPAGEQWLLQFDDKPSSMADLVIGANGGMSNVRKYVTYAALECTGSYIIQGDIAQPEICCPEFYCFCKGHVLMASSQGVNLVLNPDNDGTMSYGITFNTPDAWLSANRLNMQDKDSVIDFLLTMFGNWAEQYKELFPATTSFAGLPSRLLSLDRPWRNDRPLPITLIGDAAHIMPPFAGQGVNTGMLDAIVLADNLTSERFATLAAAISDYEQQMLIYAGEAQAETSKNEMEMHDPNFSFQKRFDN